MDTKTATLTGIATAVISIISYILCRNNRKRTVTEQAMDANSDDSVNKPSIYENETEEEFYARCKVHIESYLNARGFYFYTANSGRVFQVPFESEDSTYELMILPDYKYEGKLRVIDFAATVSSSTIPDHKLSEIAEFTNRINGLSVNSQIYLDYETRSVKIIKSLLVRHLEIDERLFHWYFKCVDGSNTKRSYINRVLLHNESPVLVALDYANT